MDILRFIEVSAVVVIPIAALFVPIWLKFKKEKRPASDFKLLKKFFVGLMVLIGITAILLSLLAKCGREDEDSSETTIQNSSIDQSISTQKPMTYDIEVEPNDDIDKSSVISLNREIHGKLDSAEDVDYYKISFDSKGSLELSFNHSKIDSESYFWHLTLLDGSQSPILSHRILGGIVKTDSNKVRVPSGTYYIKVESDTFCDAPYSFTVNFNKEDEGFESEPNNELFSANILSLNSQVTGNIQDDEDIDYYRIDVSEPGSISVSFEHDKIDSSMHFWRMELISEMSSEPESNLMLLGSEVSFKTGKIRLSTGTYYIKISKDYYSNIDYILGITFEKEGNAFENEPNNSISSANKIDVNKEITGNIQNEEDVDYYVFNVNRSGALNILFEHPKIDSSMHYWTVQLLDDTDEYKIDFEVSGENVKTTSDKIRIPAGSYYVKVRKDYYSNLDYKFKVDFE